MTETAEKMIETDAFWDVLYEMLRQKWLEQEGETLRRLDGETQSDFEIRKEISWANWCQRDFGRLTQKELDAELKEARLLLIPTLAELEAKAASAAPVYFDGEYSDNLLGEMTGTE
jgi:hypothetical protein